MPVSLWDLAVEKRKEQIKRLQDLDADLPTEQAEDNKQVQKVESKERENSYVVVCGSKDCGKTSLVLRFLDRDELPKPTVALEYTYGRRTRGNTKEVAHLWELGSGGLLTKLLDIPINPEILPDTSIVLMLDMSHPETLWVTMETLLTALKDRVKIAFEKLKAKDPIRAAQLQAESWAKFAESKEKDMLQPFLIPLAIVGAKYDIFQELELEKRRLIIQTLRFVAHFHGASLQVFSTKVETLVTRGRALLSHLAFNTTSSKVVALDVQKPVFVYAGGDTFADIGVPPTNSAAMSASNPWQLWKNSFEAMFPQQQIKLDLKDDPAKDPQYREDSIDKLRAQKDQELERYMRQRGRNIDNDHAVTSPRDEKKAGTNKKPVQRDTSDAKDDADSDS